MPHSSQNNIYVSGSFFRSIKTRSGKINPYADSLTPPQFCIGHLNFLVAINLHSSWCGCKFSHIFEHNGQLHLEHLCGGLVGLMSIFFWQPRHIGTLINFGPNATENSLKITSPAFKSRAAIIYLPSLSFLFT